MLPRNHPDRIQIAFDDHRLVANAGLILPATLALRLGLPQLLRKHLDLGGAPGRANTGDKMMTMVAYALAGGYCIDDADVLRAGGTVGVLGCVVKASSTLGTFLRSFRWGHVRQLDRVSRHCLTTDNSWWPRSIIARLSWRLMDRTSLTKIPLHRQLTYLLVELGYQLLLALALLSMPGPEQLRRTLDQLLLPGMDQRRMNLKPAGKLRDGLISSKTCQGYLGLERPTVLPA